ncbi:MAG: DUF3105 domain-containing protein [Nitriliruptorales bacterium]
MTEATPDATDRDRLLRRRRLRHVGLLGVGLVVLVVGLVQITSRGAESVTRSAAEVETATREAGCAAQDVPAFPPQHIISESDATPADELYPVRPPHSGPHFRRPVTPVGAFEEPVDERAALQNMERGAVVLWFDPDAIDESDRRSIADYVERRNEMGFAQGSRGGAGLIAAPYPDGLASGKALALRTWHVAVDCDRFDPVAVDGFLAQNFGAHGPAPNADIAGYPEDALRVVDSG